MRDWLTIGAAGELGVLARHVVQQAVPRHGGIPWDTFVVNVTGAFASGFVAAFVVHKLRTPLWAQETITVGFLGGYTTFSAFSLETFLLLDRGRIGIAAAYSLGSVLAGLAAVFVGVRAGRVL
jgi:fluoride exporter